MADTFPVKSDASLNKLLFSSPMQFGGTFENQIFYIHHAFPGSENPGLRGQQKIRNSATRYYYVLLFQAEPLTPIGKISIVNDYTYFAQEIIASLSVFFGKQFDNHGLIERAGMFEVPDMSRARPLRDIELAPFNEKFRSNAGVDLNFTKSQPILKLFEINSGIDERLKDLFRLGARLYLRSLKTFHDDIESAYLDLVVCGEIISGYFDDYNDEQKYDEALRNTFARLDAAGIELEHISRIKSRVYSVKRRFNLGIQRLLNESFFQKLEALYPHDAISKEKISALIQTTYDIRSDHTHNGTHIGYVGPNFGSELSTRQNYKDGKIAYGNRCLSYLGLERLIRFCLLSLLHRGGLPIHPDLTPDAESIGFHAGAQPGPQTPRGKRGTAGPSAKAVKPVAQDEHDRAVDVLNTHVQSRSGNPCTAQADASRTRWKGDSLLLFDGQGRFIARLRDGLEVTYCYLLEGEQKSQQQTNQPTDQPQPP